MGKWIVLSLCICYLVVFFIYSMYSLIKKSKVSKDIKNYDYITINNLCDKENLFSLIKRNGDRYNDFLSKFNDELIKNTIDFNDLKNFSKSIKEERALIYNHTYVVKYNDFLIYISTKHKKGRISESAYFMGDFIYSSSDVVSLEQLMDMVEIYKGDIYKNIYKLCNDKKNIIDREKKSERATLSSETYDYLKYIIDCSVCDFKIIPISEIDKITLETADDNFITTICFNDNINLLPMTYRTKRDYLLICDMVDDNKIERQ